METFVYKLFRNSVIIYSLLYAYRVGASDPTDELRAKLISDQSPESQFIEFDQDRDTQNPRVLQSPPTNSNTPFQYSVTLKGRLLKKGISVLLDHQKVEIMKGDQFSIQVPIESGQQVFVLLGVADDGDLSEYHGEVRFPQFNNPANKSGSLKGLSILSSLGVSYDTLRQTGVSDFSQVDLRFKAGASYFITDEGWNVSVESYYTVLPFGSNQTSGSMNILALDVRAGRKFQLKPIPRWSINALGGWSYLTTFASEDMMGFKNAYGAQLYTTVEYQVVEKQSLFFNLKYAPNLNGQALFSINNSQIGIEGGYSLPLMLPNHLLRASVEFFRFGLTVGPKQLYLNNYIFSLAYDLRL